VPAPWRDPGDILRPSTVAIAGASPDARWPKRLFLNLKEGGYPGRVFLINPKYAEVWGERCYPSAAELPETPDVVYLLVPAEHTLGVLREAARRGTKGAVIFAAGYAEQGDDTGRARQTALTDFARATGLRIVGPNCFGCVSAAERLFAYPQSIAVRAGGLAIVAQSGGAVGTLLRGAGDRAIGISYAVSSGNEADLELADYVHWLAADGSTAVVAVFVEGIRDPERFAAAADECLQAGKPIVAVKVGRTQQSSRGALSHTGSLTGSDAAFDALCRRSGIVRCLDLSELLETAAAFLPGRWSTIPAVAGLTISGGQMSVLPDLADAAQVPLAVLADTTVRALGDLVPPRVVANPLDSSSSGFTNQENYTRIAETMLQDPGVGCLVMQGDQFLTLDAPVKPEVWARLNEQPKPVLLFSRGYYSLDERERAFQAAARLPFVQGPLAALRAARKLSEYARIRARSVAQRVPPTATTGAVDSPRPAQIAGFGELSSLLRDRGIDVVPHVLAASTSELMEGASRIGFPSVLKIESPEATHKAAAGLLRLGICTQADLHSAFDELQKTAEKLRLHRYVYLLQRMLFGGAEYIVGAAMDPQFGAILMVGRGGSGVERDAVVTHALLPSADGEIEDMLARASAGATGDDHSALKPLVERFAALAMDVLHRPSDSIELNPVLVRPDGATVLDARFVPADDPSLAAPRTPQSA